MYKIEYNSQIDFLDIMVIKNENGTLIFDLYRKPTFSGRYLNFYVAHSIHTKIGTVKILANKAFTLCDESFHKKNSVVTFHIDSLHMFSTIFYFFLMLSSRSYDLQILFRFM